MDDSPSSENGIDFSPIKQGKKMYHYLLKCNRCDRNPIARFHFMYSVFGSLLILEHYAAWYGGGEKEDYTVFYWQGL